MAVGFNRPFLEIRMACTCRYDHVHGVLKGGCSQQHCMFHGEVHTPEGDAVAEQTLLGKAVEEKQFGQRPGEAYVVQNVAQKQFLHSTGPRAEPCAHRNVLSLSRTDDGRVQYPNEDACCCEVFGIVNIYCLVVGMSLFAFSVVLMVPNLIGPAMLLTLMGCVI